MDGPRQTAILTAIAQSKRGEAEWQRFMEDPVRYLEGDPVAFSAGVRSALDNMLAAGEPDAQVAVFTHRLLTNIVLSRILSLERIVTSSPAMARSRA
jgi:predicted component of type VI protein secretion system